MTGRTPPGTARALRVNVKRRKFESVPAWPTGSAGLSMIVTDAPGWAVVHDNSGVMAVHTRTWEGARKAAVLMHDSATRNGRSWANECDMSAIMSSATVSAQCSAIARDYKDK